MPLPLAPIITAGATLGGAAINAFATGSMNRKTRNYNREMYWLQRQHAEEDWEKQNAYNSPLAQMQRLRDAKLNPHLVYGDGATATSSSAVRSSQVESWKPDVPNYGEMLTGPLGAYFDVQQKQAIINNLAKDGEIKTQQKLLTMAQYQTELERAVNLGEDTKTKTFNLDQRRRLADTAAEMMQEELRKLKMDTTVLFNRDQREAAANAANIREAAARILTMAEQRAKSEQERKEIRARIDSLDTDTKLKKLHLKLREMGVEPGDSVFMKALATWFQGIKDFAF